MTGLMEVTMLAAGDAPEILSPDLWVITTSQAVTPPAGDQLVSLSCLQLVIKVCATTSLSFCTDECSFFFILCLFFWVVQRKQKHRILPFISGDNMQIIQCYTNRLGTISNTCALPLTAKALFLCCVVGWGGSCAVLHSRRPRRSTGAGLTLAKSSCTSSTAQGL